MCIKIFAFVLVFEKPKKMSSVNSCFFLLKNKKAAVYIATKMYIFYIKDTYFIICNYHKLYMYNNHSANHK